MKAVVLLSGGVDSMVTACLAGPDPFCLGINYGQPHLIELGHAKRFAAQRGWKYREARVSMGASGLITDASAPVVVGRNAALLSVAVTWAGEVGADSVHIGCNAADAALFPDCRPKFVAAFSEMSEATYGVRVVAPLLNLSKAEVVQTAIYQGISLDDPWTCYAPHKGEPCGDCLACETFAAAVAEVDP